MNLINRELWTAFRSGGIELFRPQYFLFALVFICCGSISVMLAPMWIGAMGAVLSSLVLMIAFVDARSFTIPDELTAAGAVFGLLHASLQSHGQLATALLSAIVQSVVLIALFWGLRIAYRWFRGRDGLGLGDVKLAGVAGAWLTPSTIPLVIEIAALSGLAVYIVHQYAINRPLRANGRLPFGAFFAPAIWFGWVFEAVMAGRS